ncbi:MAG: GNAT family N-acetyltransferase [Ruthenibacterium sp.]
MHIRLIALLDNTAVENLIRTCLIEFGADIPGCAWEDKNLGRFYEVYQPLNASYWVAEDNGKIVAGCGIGPVAKMPAVCELQKMYTKPTVRGTGLAAQMLKIALSFAQEHYSQCYLETFSNMIAANHFYLKHGFVRLPQPLIASAHYACDMWYLKSLKEGNDA